MADKIQLRRDLAANWTSADPILAQGELGYELDTCKIKIGDGIAAWSALDYKFSIALEIIVTAIGNLTSTNVQDALVELQTEIDALTAGAITDHTALSNIGTNTHAQIDTHIAATNNPHNVTKAQVGLSNVDNTSDINKPVSTAQQTALDLKYDASNPSNYIDSAGAPVQPGDIANFETTTQLNARDAANRDRANHTGTQTASTISDLPAFIAANETVTSLSFNNTTKILTYTNEAGTVVNVDLTQFLDDTNLARIVNGTVDAGTGIATFVRDDTTTFTVDFGAFLDNTNLSRIVSGSVTGNDLILLRNDSSTITIDLSPFAVDLSNYYTKTEIDVQQDAQNTNITSNSTAITNLQNEQTTQNTNITNNASAISTEITNRANADATLQAAIDSNDTDITNLQNEQTTQNTAIAVNTAKVSFPEAPNDGQKYVRQSEGWVLESTASGGVTSVNGDTGPAVVLNASDVGADPAGTATAAITAHEAAADPHSQYTTEAENDARYYTQTQVNIQQAAQDLALSNEITARTNADTNLQNQIDSNDIDIARIDALHMKTVNQAAHGFTLTNGIPIPVYVDTTTGLVEPSLANDKDTLTGAFITEVVDINNFVLSTANQIITAPSHGLLPGHFYYLSETVPGGVIIDTPTGKFDDIVFYIIDANCILLKDNRPIDVDSLQKWMIKTTNTDNTQDYDDTAVVEAQVTGSTLIDENPGYYTIVGNGIQVPETRTYKIRLSIPYVQSGGNDRKRLRGRIYVNGNPVGAILNSHYGRGSNGDNHWSFNVYEVLVLQANDIVTFRTNRQTTDGTGTILMDGIGTCYFIIELK